MKFKIYPYKIIGGEDEYGQDIVTESGKIEACLSIPTIAVTSDPLYNKSTLMALLHKPVDESYIIDGKKVTGCREAGQYYIAFLSEEYQNAEV